MTRPTPSQLAQAAVNSARNAKVSTGDQRLWHLAEAVEYLALAFGDFAVMAAQDAQVPRTLGDDAEG